MSAPEMSIPAALAELDRLDMPALKARWESVFDTPAPRGARDFLISRLSYRIQELRLGGLDEATARRLAAMTAKMDADGGRKPYAPDLPPVGTRLVREWKGVAHTVTITRDGFEYEGRPYVSLSAIARSITGTRWSGPYFFGLARRPR